MWETFKYFKEKLVSGRVALTGWQLNFTAAAYILLGLIIGLFLALSGALVGIFADATSSITKTNDTDFSQGTLSSTEVVGTGTSAYLQLVAASGDPWLNGWAYRKKITFSNGSYAENLVNFPVLVKLTSSNFDFSKAQSAGQDIRFTDSDGTTTLSYEIESWSSGSQTANIWVKVPQIDSASNTDYMYMYYYNSGASDAQNKTGVWNSGYSGVWHLDDSSGTSVLDSTSHAYNGTKVSSTEPAVTASGYIASGQSFDGVNDKISLVSPSLLVGDATTSFSLEAWVNIGTETGTYFMDKRIFTANASTNNGGCTSTSYGLLAVQFQAASSRNIQFNMPYNYSGACQGETTVPYGNVNRSQWYHVVATFNASSKQLTTYLDGAPASVATWGSTAPVTWFSTVMDIGGGQYYVGTIDEARISTVARSGAWVAAEYSNMSGTSYTTFGSEQAAVTSSGTWETAADSNAIDLVWNGGWGDGSAGSTAFSATVANVGANATISFQVRVAATLGALTSASYSSLGTANSGTVFSVTNSTFTSLGVGVGSNRYAQIKATLSSTDNITNPQLADMTLFYLSDNTPPESNASTLQMEKVQGGTVLSSNDWTNGDSPYFSWTAGSDSQSGLKGYCLYIGTDAFGDPAVSKGLLGTSVVSTTGTTCQFITNATNIDFATTSLRGSPWLTSSTATYYFSLKAVDNMGNIVGSSIKFQFRFDNTPPTNPSFISVPSDFTSSKDIEITWPTSGGVEASDAASGLAGLQYRIGQTAWYGDNHTGTEDSTDLLVNDGTYTTDPTVDYPNMAEGVNTVYFRTWDVAGNVTTTYITGALKINTVAPSAPQNLQATPTDNTTNAYAFSWDVPANFSGDVNNLRYCYTVNATPNSNNCTFTAAGVTSLTEDAFATQPGTNTLYLSAKDEAGNINYAVYTTVNFTYSGSAPGIPTGVEVNDISVKASSIWKLVVSWTAPTNAGAGISTYKIYRSTTSGASCSSSPGSFSEVATTAGKSFADSGLTQQTYYYCVKACDSANNCSAYSQTRSGYPDGKFDAPAELTSSPVVTQVTNTKATVTWNTERNSDSRVSYGLGSNKYFPEEASKSTQTTAHEIQLDNLSPGTTYFLRALWVDEDGNQGRSDEKLFTTLPAPTVTDVTVSGVNVDSANIKFNVTRAQAVKVYYGPTTGFGAVEQINTASTTSSYLAALSKLDDGTKYFFKVNPIDLDGNEYQGTVLDFKTIAKPRISKAKIQEISGESQTTLEVTWETNTATNSIVTYYPVSNPSSSQDAAEAKYISGAHKIRIVGLVPSTDYKLQISGRDSLGNEAKSEIFNFSTGEDSRPPKIEGLKVETAIVKPANNQSGDVASAQMIVTWDTDEPSTSQVEFGEGASGVFTNKSTQDQKLVTNHLVVLSKLQPSKVYHLRVLSSDAAKNEGTSGVTVSITPRAADSIIDIILKNLSDALGFL